MLDKAYFDADEYEREGWVDQLKYEWEILDELERRQKLKDDQKLRKVCCGPVSSWCKHSWPWHVVGSPAAGRAGQQTS